MKGSGEKTKNWRQQKKNQKTKQTKKPKLEENSNIENANWNTWNLVRFSAIFHFYVWSCHLTEEGSVNCKIENDQINVRNL